MSNPYKPLPLRRKMEVLVEEMVEKELSLKEALREFEKIYIEKAEAMYNGNKTRMAKALGIHRNTLHNLCKTLDLE